MEEKTLNRTLIHSTKDNKINMCHSCIQKHASYEKLFKYYTYLNIFNQFKYYTGLQKSFPIHYSLWGEFFF